VEEQNRVSGSTAARIWRHPKIQIPLDESLSSWNAIREDQHGKVHRFVRFQLQDSLLVEPKGGAHGKDVENGRSHDQEGNLEEPPAGAWIGFGVGRGSRWRVRIQGFREVHHRWGG